MPKKREICRAVLAGALLTGAGTGIFSNAAAVFIGPVCAGLGLERGGFTLISSISLISSMAALPLFGRLLASADIKLLAALCSAVCAAVPLGYSFCGRLWQFYLLAAVNGFFVNGITLLTIGALIERMDLKAGGRLLGAAFAGAGGLSFLTLPLLQKTVDSFGWRWGYRVQAAAGAAILLLAVLLIKNAAPLAKSKRKRDGSAFKRAAASRCFWPAAAGLLLANAANLALFSHTAANLTDLGFSSQAATLALSFAALLSSASKPLYGLALDKLGLKAGSAALGAALSLAAVSALLLPKAGAALYLYPVLLSVCGCANAIPANAFASRLFEKADFAAAASLFTLAATAGSAIGPPAAGAVFDLAGSYNYVWLGCAAAGLASGALLARAASRPEVKGL